MNHIFKNWCDKKPQLYLTPLLFYAWLPPGRLRSWDSLTRYITIDSAVWHGAEMLQKWLVGLVYHRAMHWTEATQVMSLEPHYEMTCTMIFNFLITQGVFPLIPYLQKRKVDSPWGSVTCPESKPESCFGPRIFGPQSRALPPCFILWESPQNCYRLLFPQISLWGFHTHLGRKPATSGVALKRQ